MTQSATDVRAHARRTRAWVAPVLVFVGILAVQVAWISSFPAFRGIDEHDHVYRADSVAAGEVRPSGETTEESRGELLSVRRSIIDAAGPVCESLPYTKRYDCHAYTTDGPDRALVASAAARYNPVFYWVIGTAARPFEGTQAVYAMRVATSAICALLIALAFLVMQRLTESRWRLAALLGVLTPTMTYSSSVAAPNGVEMSAALLAWVSLLALARDAEHSTVSPRWLAVAAGAGLCVLSTVRTLGPLWAVLIVATVLIASAPRKGLWSMIRERSRSTVAIGAAWGAALLLGVAWSALAGTNDPHAEGTTYDVSPWPGIPRQVVLWVFQSVGAFPTRGSQAPAVVYALFLTASACVIWLGFRRTTGRRRMAMLGVLAAVVVGSVAITVAAFSAAGYSWQGRYVWPLSMGLPLLAGLSISVVAGRRRWLLCLTAALACATAISQVSVLDLQLADATNPDSWSMLPAPAVVGLTLLGFACVFLADLSTESQQGEHLQNDLA